MQQRVRSISLALLIGLLFLGGFVSALAQAQQNPTPPSGAPGARQSLGTFFEAMGAGDLVLLKAGGALSGTVQGDQFTVNTTAGQSQTLKRTDIAFMSFGDKSDQVGLMTGDVVTGSVQVDSLSITLPTAAQITLQKAQIETTVFKLNIPGEGR